MYRSLRYGYGYCSTLVYREISNVRIIAQQPPDKKRSDIQKRPA